MIKVTDYIAKRLKEYGVRDIFMITGGGAMHLNDSLGREFNYICNHHEQACAIAAEGYARLLNKLAVVNVTTGPGGLNTLNGVFGQWTDSVPVLYISGQVKFETTIHSCPDVVGLRQLGDQEVDIVSVVKPITKFACMVTEPDEIRYLLEKAIYIATTGRPGPVWLDVPLNVQGALVDEQKLKGYVPESNESAQKETIPDVPLQALIQKLKAASRPLIYVGNGVRISDSIKQFFTFAESLGIPIVTAISGHDIVPYDHPLFFGKPGICGDRLGNVMVQNADLLLIMGTRLSIRQVGFNFSSFAPQAFKVMIDIDQAELNKPTLDIDLKINSDLKVFFDKLLPLLKGQESNNYSKWIEWAKERKKELPTVIEDNVITEGYANSYVFADELFKQLDKGAVVVTGNGTAYTSTYQVMKVKKGVRVIANQGCASMGYDLPAGIGACVANDKKPVIIITGDGSMQMNIQELQTIQTYKLPVKLFVLENQGYLAIRSTQTAYFNKRYIGSSPEGGVICPDLEKIAYAYGILFKRVKSNDKLEKTISDVLGTEGPVICEIVMDPAQTLFPKATSKMNADGKMESMPLDVMFPFLSDEEQARNIFK